MDALFFVLFSRFSPLAARVALSPVSGRSLAETHRALGYGSGCLLHEIDLSLSTSPPLAARHDAER